MRVLICIVVVLASIGYSIARVSHRERAFSSYIPGYDVAKQVPINKAEPIKFDGFEWEYSNAINGGDQVGGSEWKNREYVGDFKCMCVVVHVFKPKSDQTRRLLVVIPPPKNPASQREYTKVYNPQVKRNGKWITHGKVWEDRRDGSKRECGYRFAKKHGHERYWHANGKIESEAEFDNGKQIGTFRLWYENGQLTFEAKYCDGRRVKQDYFNEVGTKIENYSFDKTKTQ